MFYNWRSGYLDNLIILMFVVISYSGDSIDGWNGGVWFPLSKFVSSVGSGASTSSFSPTVVLTESSGDVGNGFDRVSLYCHFLVKIL